MLKLAPATEQFQHFVSNLRESFWGDLNERTREAWQKFFEADSERQRDRFAVVDAYERNAKQRQDYRNGYYERDLKELAVAVASQENGGFFFDSGAKGGGGGGSAYGDIFNGEATVRITLFNTAYTGPRDYQGGYALTALHEIIHLAGRDASAFDGSRGYYIDVVLADAVKILTGAPGYPEGNNRNLPPWQITAEMTTAAGDYWDAQLKEHCLPQEWRARAK